MASKNNTTSKSRTHDSLSMQIYAAVLGDRPKITRAPSDGRPRLSMRVRVEARLEHEGVSPFRTLTLRDHLGRCAAYAARALDDARARLQASKPATPLPTPVTAKRATDAKPVVLIGPAAMKRSPRHAPAAHSRAA